MPLRSQEIRSSRIPAAIAELPPSDGLDALDALLALDLIRPTTVPRRFVFRHPLVRRGLRGDPAGWRLGARARRRAGAAALAAERAHHAEQYAGQGTGGNRSRAGGRCGGRREAPAAAARWFEAALRLLPARDERQVDVRVALASSLRSLGELDRCRAALLEAHELLPANGHPQGRAHGKLRAVEHWLGRHEKRIDACHAPGRSFPTARRPRPRCSRPSSRSTVSELDFAQAVEMGLRALATAREVGDRPLIAAAAAALSRGGNGRACRRRRRASARGATEVDALSDAELAPRLEALYHLAWAETYLEHYEDAVAHAERGVAIARAFGQGRLLVPLSLARNFPFEMQGRLRDAIELCESALEAARLSESAHELYRALFELGWTLYYAGDLAGALAAHEESFRVDPRLAGGTIPNGGGGPGWGLGVTWLESGEIERGRTLLSLAERMSPARCPSSAASTGRASRSPSLPWDVDAADGYARRAERDAAQLPLKLPSALAGRARAAVLLACGEPVEAARVAHESAEAAGSVGANLQAAFSRGLEGRALAAGGQRLEAIAVLRQAERELDTCGSVRVRDGCAASCGASVRAPSRVAGRSGDSGVDALSKRELEIAELVTDRLTNREIAAALFLSDKTIESHLRNIFHKLGVTSRVEVARTVEREAGRVRGRAGVTSLAPPVDPDAARLEELGYRQELARGLHLVDNAAMGFAGISPVVGLYAVALVGLTVAGPAWVWVLPSR